MDDTAADAATLSGQRAATAPDRPDGPSRAGGPRRTSLTVLVLVFVGFISLGLPDGLLGVAWPSIRQTFDLPIDALGAVFLTTVSGYLVASLTSGWVVKRIGVGMLLALSAVATTVFLLTYAFAPSWGVMVAIGLVAGLGGGAIDAGLNSYVALAHSPRLLSWLHACFGVGAATGPAIMMTVLSAGQPWRVGYLIVGLGQLLLAICFLLTRRRWQTDTEVDLTPPAPLSGAERGETSGLERLSARSDVDTAAAPRSPSPRRRGGWGVRFPLAVWLSILLFLVYTGIETAAGQWAYSLFVEGRAFSAQAAGLSVSAYWGMLAVGRVLSGIVAHRIAPAPLTRWSMVGMLAGAILIWLNAADWLSFLGLALMGLAAAAVFPSMIAVTPERFGAARAPSIIGFQVGAAALGIAGIPALAGVLAARAGFEAIPALLVVASLGMVGLHEAVVRLADLRLPGRELVGRDSLTG
jgi:fucose permease